MPRLGRVVVANYPHHVVQRGHNKHVVFAEEADYLYYLSTLEEFKDLYDVKVYGFGCGSFETTRTGREATT